MSDLPRLLLCSFDVVPSPTGASRRVTQYLKGLSEHFQVVVLSVKTPDHSHIERLEGARLLRVPIGTGDFASRVQAFDRAVRRQVDSEEYALVHCLDPFGGHAVSELKPHYSYKLVYDAERFPSQELATLQPSADSRLIARARRQELFCLMNADLVITGSEVTRQFIRSVGVPESAIRLIRAPVDVPAYATVPSARREVRGALRVFHLSGRAAFEDVETVLEAVQRANARTPVSLVVVGSRPPEGPSAWEVGAAARGLGEEVELRDPVPHGQLPMLLSEADLCLVPLADVGRNRVQGTPVAQLSEYLAAGRAVLAADLPSVRERLGDACGLYYPPGDADALAARLVELAKDGERRARMGRAARIAAAELDGTRARALLTEAYASLIGALARAADERGAEAVTSTGTGPRRIDPDTQRRKGGSKSDPRPPIERSVPIALAPSGGLLPAPRTKVDAELELEPAPAADSAPAPEPVPRPHAKVAPSEDPQLPDTDPSRAAPPTNPKPLRPKNPFASAEPTKTAAPTARSAAAMTFAKPGAAPKPAAPRAPPVTPPGGVARHDTVRETPAVVLPTPTPPPLRAATPKRTDTAPSMPAPLLHGHPVHTVSTETPLADDAEEINADDLVESDEPRASLAPDSNLNPWLAQLVHGYCPPEATHFPIHTPPTNFPGRDAPPPAGTPSQREVPIVTARRPK